MPDARGKGYRSTLAFDHGTRMRTVITYGTFDLLHRGHVNLLHRASELGDRLIVGLSTDEFNVVKDKESYYAYEERLAVLQAIRYVDLVIAEDSWDQKVADIRDHDVDVFVMGDDWQGHFDGLRDHCEVIYLPRTTGISTTQIKLDLAAPPDGGR